MSLALIDRFCPIETHMQCLFDLTLYAPVNNFFSHVGTSVPGLNY